MSGDFNTSRTNHRRFIEAAVAAETVWTLEGDHGVASRISDDPDERVVLQFWSGAAGAESSAIGEWAGYQTDSITLYDFLFRWLPGMEADDALVGTNTGKDAPGLEAEPADLETELREAMGEAKVAQYEARLEQELAKKAKKPGKKKK